MIGITLVTEDAIKLGINEMNGLDYSIGTSERSRYGKLDVILGEISLVQEGIEGNCLFTTTLK